MLTMIIVLVFVLALALASVQFGMRELRAVRDQFDELMPQRMVDYAGFIDSEAVRD